jgi:hypothetical protein
MKLGCLWLLSMSMLAGCSQPSASRSIAAQLEASGTIDLRAAMPGSWDRVCVFGPYSTDQDAFQTLGFSWSLTDNSAVWQSDGVSLLVFARGNEVVAAVDHPRRNGDFSTVADRCFSPEQAQFVRVAEPKEGPPGLAPRVGA